MVSGGWVDVKGACLMTEGSQKLLTWRVPIEGEEEEEERRGGMVSGRGVM